MQRNPRQKPFITCHLLTALTLSLCSLSACSLFETNTPNEPLLPLPSADTSGDLDDRYLKLAMTDYIARNNAPKYTRYDYVRSDLNNDGQLDALVKMKAPYGHWCGDDGCTILAFLARNTSFELIGTLPQIRTPLYISKQSTHGVRDLIIHLSGKHDKARYAILSFDGHKYNEAPESAPTYPDHPAPQLTKVFP